MRAIVSIEHEGEPWPAENPLVPFLPKPYETAAAKFASVPEPGWPAVEEMRRTMVHHVDGGPAVAGTVTVGHVERDVYHETTVVLCSCGRVYAYRVAP